MYCTQWSIISLYLDLLITMGNLCNSLILSDDYKQDYVLSDNFPCQHITMVCFINWHSHSQFLGKLQNLWVRGAAYSANPYISCEWPYLRKRFYTCPFIFPKDSKKFKIQNCSPPPSATRPKFFAPPSWRVRILSPPPKLEKSKVSIIP